MPRARLLAAAALAGAPALASPPPHAAPASCHERAIQRQAVRAAEVLADWPQLARYREANARLGPPRAGEARVVFLGDSITESWSEERHGGFFPGRPWVNRGISGQTSAQMLVRFRADVIALRPRAVVIHAGTNDLAGNTGPATVPAISGHLASMADLARANGVRVVLASVLPVSDDDRDRGGTLLLRTRCRPPAQIEALNHWMRGFAAREAHTYLDYHSPMADARGLLRPELSDDGLHPNAKGYAVMAPLAERAVAHALGRP